jgi:hypothetical protein
MNPWTIQARASRFFNFVGGYSIFLGPTVGGRAPLLHVEVYAYSCSHFDRLLHCPQSPAVRYASTISPTRSILVYERLQYSCLVRVAHWRRTVAARPSTQHQPKHQRGSRYGELLHIWMAGWACHHIVSVPNHPPQSCQWVADDS